jgi:hypothetical protein
VLEEEVGSLGIVGGLRGDSHAVVQLLLAVPQDGLHDMRLQPRQLGDLTGPLLDGLAVPIVIATLDHCTIGQDASSSMAVGRPGVPHVRDDARNSS